MNPQKPEVSLLHYTDLKVASTAIRTCYNTHHKSDFGGEQDQQLIHRVGNIYKHSSTLEHLTYSFYISNISRACLQELARHRIASYSVKSSRYTLSELKRTELSTLEQASQFIKLTGNDDVDRTNLLILQNLKSLLLKPTPNDIAKFAMPEAYLTELTWTINARSLQNFLRLRLDKRAMWEIRDLAQAVLDSIPTEHRYLYQNCQKEQ